MLRTLENSLYQNYTIVCTFPKSEANNKEKFYFIADTVSKNTSNKVLRWDRRF